MGFESRHMQRFSNQDTTRNERQSLAYGPVAAVRRWPPPEVPVAQWSWVLGTASVVPAAELVLLSGWTSGKARRASPEAAGNFSSIS